MSNQAAILQRQAVQLQRQGRRPEAIDAYRRLLALQPELADCWYNLGYLLRAEGHYDAALVAYGEALARQVSSPEEVHLNRAVIYSDHLRRDEAAERELRAALELNPDYLPARLNLGNLQEERGERDAALATYAGVLASGDSGGEDAHRDLRGEALARIANLRAPEGADDPLLAQLRTTAANVSLDRLTRANLYFSLGRALDRLGLHEQAFAAFADANRNARQTGPVYSRIRARRQVDALIAAFPNSALPARAERPAQEVAQHGANPLFICGMFRSGSTLVEQVLGAHPAVTAGGEIDFLPRLVRGPLAPFPASAQTLDASRLDALAGEYRAHLARLHPSGDSPGRFITDKRPDNFLLIGLIKRLFPAARIIHTTRHPLDNGFSIFMQHLNQQAVSYASDLADIGHYYGQYRRLMSHWKHLYQDSILDFDYDTFVREPRPSLERLLGFLGLEWHARCLEFHRFGGTVKTASYWQVRRPLYSEASGRWRNYRPQLDPLVTALREAGVYEQAWG